MTLFTLPLTAFVLAALVSQRLARSPKWLNRMMDESNARSLHKGAIPRTGGLAILVGLFGASVLAVTFLPIDKTWAWIPGAVLPVAVVSLADDHHSIHPLFRLGAHLGAGLILIFGGLAWSQLELPGLRYDFDSWMSVALTLLLVIWMTNLFNFMDGMDGLAGGMAMFGFGTLAMLGWRGDELTYALINASIAAAAGGFLTVNFPPARLFLGDLGSTSLGLLAVAMSLLGNANSLFPLWVAGLIFSPFIIDATVTLLRRTCRRERLWEPHRSHHYQRLVLAGWSHRRVMVRAWVLMAACSISAFVAPTLAPAEQWLLLLGWTVIYIQISYRVRLVEDHPSGFTAP